MAVLLFSPTFAYDVKIQFSKFHKKVDLKASLDLKGFYVLKFLSCPFDFYKTEKGENWSSCVDRKIWEAISVEHLARVRHKIVLPQFFVQSTTPLWTAF